MGLFRITLKKSGNTNAIRFEKGMTFDVVSKYSNPLLTNGGHEVQDAFMRIYGIDIKKAGCLNGSSLEVVKIN